jgi:hypothetical protein
MMETSSPIRRRKVFFIPGFDPLGARRYRELYRTHAKRQGDIAGYDIAIRGRPGRGAYGWDISSTQGDLETSTELDFLQWSDLVKSAMKVSILRSYRQLGRTLWLYLSSGAYWRLVRLRYIPMMIATYPAVALTLFGAVALLLGIGVSAAVEVLGGLWWVGSIIGVAAGVAFLLWVRRKDAQTYAFYLMSDYAYNAQDRGRMPADLADRVEDFVGRVDDALAGPYDEVLIVGHSSGAHIGVHLAARARAVPEGGPAFALLTLGQVIPMVSFLPTASDLRGDLHRAACRRDLFWADVSAPADGACFALSNPVAVSGVDPAEAEKQGPTVISAKFSRTLSDRQQRELRWRYFRRHVQYLRSFERPEDYDYFAITAGPQSLRARYGGRSSSASTIWDPLSPFQDME